MPITLPTLDELHQQLLNDFRSRFPTAEWGRNGDNWKRLRILAGTVWGLYYQQQIQDEDLYPDTATDDALVRIGTIWGVDRKGATGARKSDALRVFGTNGSSISSGDQLVSGSGLLYQVNENETVDSVGYVDVDVVAISTGAATRLLAGDVLTFSSPPAGIEAEAELQLDLDEDGEDIENEGAYRNRILAKISQPGQGGNANDYKQWLEEITGITTGYVYPLRRGLGTVDLAALHSGRGTVRPLDSNERAEALAYIETKRPVSVKGIRVLEVTTNPQNVEVLVQVKPGTQYQWDWGDSVALEVDSWTGATRTLAFTTNRPSDMEVGDRIVIKDDAGLGSGEQFTIEAFGGADEVVLSEAPDVAPVAGDNVYSGGDIVDSVRDALLNHIDSLGPAVGDYGTGEWDDELDPGQIEAVVFDVDGVRKVDVSVPAVTVTPEDPEFPDDDSVELIIPLRVLVRRKH